MNKIMFMVGSFLCLLVSLIQANYLDIPLQIKSLEPSRKNPHVAIIEIPMHIRPSSEGGGQFLVLSEDIHFLETRSYINIASSIMEIPHEERLDTLRSFVLPYLNDTIHSIDESVPLDSDNFVSISIQSKETHLNSVMPYLSNVVVPQGRVFSVDSMVEYFSLVIPINFDKIFPVAGRYHLDIPVWLFEGTYEDASLKDIERLSIIIDVPFMYDFSVISRNPFSFVYRSNHDLTAFFRQNKDTKLSLFLPSQKTIRSQVTAAKIFKKSKIDIELELIKEK